MKICLETFVYLKVHNKTVSEFQSIQFSTTFKQKHAKKVKVNTHTSCVSTKLQITMKDKFQQSNNKTILRNIFQGFLKLKEFQNHFTQYIHRHELAHNFSICDPYNETLI